MGSSSDEKIQFNIPNLVGGELYSIEQALKNRTLHGDGDFTRACQKWFVDQLGCHTALLTPSCTLALELATLISVIGPGDEVLVPDFTFVTTAQSIALRGATPVLCDVRSDTLNIDERRLAEALSSKTKAIMPIHYAGISAEMDTIIEFAEEHKLLVIEDAAQAIGCTYKGRPLGSLGDMAAFSFHATKNIQCGEGGMLAINNENFSDAGIIAWDKGTDRRQFSEGRIDKYQWKALGSSFLASEITAAMLKVQLKQATSVNDRRLAIWNRYNAAFAPAVQRGVVKCPSLPLNITHNGHLFYLLLPNSDLRKALIQDLRDHGIEATFHYTPLHQSEGGQRYCRKGMSLDNGSDLPQRLLRLPIYPDLDIEKQLRVIERVNSFLAKI